MARTAIAAATAVMGVHMARECIKNDRWRNDGGTDVDSASDRSFSMHARSPARVLRRVFTSVFTWTSDACWHCSDQTGIRARSLLFPSIFPHFCIMSIPGKTGVMEERACARARARKIRIELKNNSLLIVRVYIHRNGKRLCYNYPKYPQDWY